MEWYYSNNEGQQGPVSEDQLRAMISSGAVLPGGLIWKEGMPDWVAWETVPELSASAAPGAAAAAVPAPTYQAAASPVAAQHNLAQGADIPNYLWQSITATVLCCLPFGIVAIVYASKVDKLKAIGDLQNARNASNSAKLWVNLSAGSAVLVFIALLILGAVSPEASGL